jgi:hypothetical protein
MTTLPVQALVNQRWTDSQPAIWERSEGGAGGRAGGRPTDPVALGSVAIRRLTALHRMDNKCATTLEPWTNQPTNQPLLLVGPCFLHTLLRHVVMTGDRSRVQGHSAGTQAKQMHIVPVPSPLLHSVVTMPLHFLYSRPPGLYQFPYLSSPLL